MHGSSAFLSTKNSEEPGGCTANMKCFDGALHMSLLPGTNHEVTENNHLVSTQPYCNSIQVDGIVPKVDCLPGLVTPSLTKMFLMLAAPWDKNS